MSYNHREIDKKWQDRWDATGVFHAKDDPSQEQFYVLVEFPYPSGAGLHVGHPRSYTALDVVARKKRMEGKNVLFPMGWDAFGLPAENYAMKTGIHPAVVTKQNIDTFRRQLQSIGFSFDWSREVNTTDPGYYKWTQWMFVQFFKAGLAYKAAMPINWCLSCKIGLANEEVVGGKCERCGGDVEKREKEQWMIAITKYADRLLEDLKTVDYLPKIKKQQEDWIGRSEGVEIDFSLVHDGVIPSEAEDRVEGLLIRVFTTRPDTMFGVTYLVLAPEHPLVERIVTDEYRAAVVEYVRSAAKKSDMERDDETREKTGVFIGAYAINPANQEKIPIWIADYVLNHYGTGAIMAVPAHDERDFAFAQRYELPIRQVIQMVSIDKTNPPREGKRDVYRKIVHVVVRSAQGQTMLLRWKGDAWKDTGRYPVSFLVGGIEDGEDVVAAARREVLEEAGYKNLTHVTTLPMAVRVHFFAAHKDVNRVGDVQCVVFQLANDERAEVSVLEQEKHDCVFVDDARVAGELNIPDDAYFWAQLERRSAYEDGGILVNSEQFDGLDNEDAKEKIVEFVHGRWVTTYKLRDWVFSRQRYWGEPIPLVFCAACQKRSLSTLYSLPSCNAGWIPVPDDQLPVLLPNVEKYQPTETGESPLASIESFVNTTCPTCGGPAKRETDTMPNWAGSSWYFLRYIDPKNDQEFAAQEKLKYWMPVNIYNGGMEHTTLHLLYSRFWYKFLYDQGCIPKECGSEPYARRHSHGMILAEDGTKMSKSRGNVINPDDIVHEFGADTLRVYELFMGPFEGVAEWSTNGVVGVKRFLDRVMRMEALLAEAEPISVTRSLHKTIAKVTRDIEDFGFNTAVAALMSFVNIVYSERSITKGTLGTFLSVLAPFAPHVANELRERLGCSGFADMEPWPEADAELAREDEITIAIQVNGKLRGSVAVPHDIAESELIARAKADANVARHLVSEPKKTIVVSGKIVNFVL